MNLHMWLRPKKIPTWKVYFPVWKRKWCLHMNLTAYIMLAKCSKDILSSTTLNADGMHWEGVRQWSTGIHFFLFLTTSKKKRKLECLSRVAKPLGLPLTSAEVEAKFAWGQKKKNTQTRLTFVSNYLVKTVQRIGGQTTQAGSSSGCKISSKRKFFYVYTGICPKLGHISSLILPHANTEMMSLFL